MAETRQLGRWTGTRMCGRLLLTTFMANLSHATAAQASMNCKRIEQLPPVEDNYTLQQIEGYVRALPGITTFLVRQLSSRFFVVAPDDETCKKTHCYHRLLDTRGGIKEVLGLRGTGVMWLVLSPTEVPVPFFQDEYSRIGFETLDKTYIGVGLPRSGATVIVEAVPPDELKVLPQACRTGSK